MARDDRHGELLGKGHARVVEELRLGQAANELQGNTDRALREVPVQLVVASKRELDVDQLVIVEVRVDDELAGVAIEATGERAVIIGHGNRASHFAVGLDCLDEDLDGSRLRHVRCLERARPQAGDGDCYRIEEVHPPILFLRARTN